jgi:hypothetical protein
MKLTSGDDRITWNNATGHPHRPNDAQRSAEGLRSREDDDGGSRTVLGIRSFQRASAFGRLCCQEVCTSARHRCRGLHKDGGVRTSSVLDHMLPAMGQSNAYKVW